MIKIIKVDAIASTNTFLKGAVREKSVLEPTCVWAKQQTDGRGQMGSMWSTEPNKNLTFSLFFPVKEDFKKETFAINMLVSMAIQKVLLSYGLPQLKIKWPNDIMSVNKKIGGVLIENNYQGGELSGTIIGIGLNVNQENFEGLPNASSIKNILGISLLLEEVLIKLVAEIEFQYKNYTAPVFLDLKRSFENVLFRNKKPSTFKGLGGEVFTGIIQGITNEGLLVVLEEDAVVNQYDLKQIQLKY